MSDRPTALHEMSRESLLLVAKGLLAEIERLQTTLRCISQRASYGIVTPGQKEMARMADAALNIKEE